MTPSHEDRLEDALRECEYRIRQRRHRPNAWSGIQLCEAAASVARWAALIEQLRETL